MVAVFVGQGAGVTRGSANLLGGAGLLGSGTLGRFGDSVSVNAATGNVVITQQDEFLIGRGLDVGISRTYNGLAQMSDQDNGDNWQQSTTRRVFGLTGTLNTAGSTISRLGGDGSVIVYNWQTVGGVDAYWTTDGDGAHDKLVKSGATWIWTDGSSQVTETYEATAANPTTDWRIKEQKDTDGLKVSFLYVASTDKLYRVTTANHGTANGSTGIPEQSYVEYVWSGNNIVEVVTGYTDYGSPSTAADNVNKTLTRTRYAYDGQNRLISVTVDLSPDDNDVTDGKTFVTSYTYHGTTNRVATIATSDGANLTLDYDGGGRVWRLFETLATGDTRTTKLVYHSGYTIVTLPGSGDTRLDYDGSQRLTQITLPNAQTVQFGYDGDGNVASVTDTASKVTSYTYDASGNMLTSTDPEGNGVTRTYGSKNEMLTETRTILDEVGAPVNLTTRYAYDVENHLRYMVSPEGRVTEYRYTNQGELQYVVEYPEHGYTIGSAPITEGDLNSWKAGIADLSSIEIVFHSYDGRGNIIQTNGYGIATTAGVSSQSQGFNRALYIHDQSGRLLSRGLYNEATETFVYDGMGRLVASTDLAGGTMTLVFNDAAMTTTITTAAGHVSVNSYNKSGDLISVARSGDSHDVDGTTAYRYDKLGRLRMITTPRGVATTGVHNDYNSFILYDDNGRKTADIAADGSVVEYRYDAAGRLAATIAYATKLNSSKMGSLANNSGNVLLTAGYEPTPDAADVWSWNIYDDAGRLIQSIEGNGEVVAYSYDEANRLVKTIAYVTPVSVAALKAGLPTSAVTVSPVLGDRISRNFYDRDGALVAVLDGEGYLSESIYDKAGRKVEDIAYGTRTNATHWSSGSLAQLRSSASPSTLTDRSIRYVYDGQSLLRYQVDNLGHVTGFEYSLLGRARHTTTIAYAATISTTDFTFDNVKALITPLADTAVDRRSYNVYNTMGQVAYTIDPAGLVTSFGYDAAGRVVKTVSFATLRNSPNLPGVGTMDSWATTNGGHANNRVTRSYYSASGQLRFAVDAGGYVTRYDYDADGNMIAEVRFAAAISVTDASTTTDVAALAVGSTITVSHLYDYNGRRYATIDGEGYQTRREWFGNGHLARVYEAYGTADQSRTEYAYDGAGRIVSETRAFGTAEASTVQYTYDGLGNRISMTDPNGKVTSWTYDEVGRILTMTDAAAGIVSYEYNAFGQVAKITDPRGNSSYSYYDSLGRLVMVRDAEDYVTETSYTAFGEVASVTRRYNETASSPSTTVLPTVTANTAKDAITTYVYDKRGLVTSTTDAGGYVTVSVYNGFGLLTSVTRAGATTAFEYGKRGEVTKSTDAESFFENYGYDAFGNRTSVTNKVGGTTTYTYDKRGLLLTETLPIAAYNADGSVQASSIVNSYSYDARGNRIQVVEGFGLTEARTTSYQYDKLNRVTQVTGQSFQGHTPVETIAYDAAGNVTRTVDAAGSHTVHYYDDLGRKRMSIDMAGTVSTFEYDANGNVVEARVYATKLTTIPSDGGAFVAAPTEVTGGGSRVTSFSYDRLSRLVTSSVAAIATGAWNGSSWITASDALTTSYVYDAFGNVVKAIDPNQHSGGVPVSNAPATWSWYDKLGRKTHQVDTLNYLTVWAYDAEGNVTTETRYANAAAAPTSIETPPAATVNADHDRVTSFTYDKNGNRLTEARAGIAVHDGTGGLLAPQTVTIEWLYNGLGQVVRKTEATGDQTNYTYDVGGRLEQEQRAGFTNHLGAGVTPTVDYRYNGLGDLVRTVQLGTSGDVDQRATTYSYTGGKLASTTDAADYVRNYKYDVMGRVTHEYYTRLKSDGTAAHAYEGTLTSYDVVGRVAEQWQATSTNATSWTAASPVMSTRYNAFGEVEKSGLNAAGVIETNKLWQTENKYDAAGRVWATNAGDGVWKYFAYDRNGNQTLAITSAGEDLHDKSYAYAFDRIGQENVNATYTVYDARNMATSAVEEQRRLSASATDTITTARTYNAFGEVLTETNALGGVTTYAYNKMGRMVRSEGPAVAITLENGKEIWVKPSQDFYYDKSGRLVATRDANGSYAETGTDAGTATGKTAHTGNLTRLTLLAGTGYDGGQALVTAQIAADGGVQQAKYDIHGDVRVTIDPMNREVEQVFDKLGRLVERKELRQKFINNDPNQGLNTADDFIDSYGYDILGQRIKHWNNFPGLSGDVETTDYDIQGRVIATRAFGGDVTTISYAWQNNVAAISGVITGGWEEVTTMANGRTLTERSDLVGRVTWKQDLGSNVTTYAYDVAGRQTTTTMGLATTTFTWFNTGQIATNSGPNGTATYSYDKAGNRKTETLVNGANTIKNMAGDYDAMGRLIAWSAQTTASQPAASIQHKYDANGNIRRTHGQQWGVTATGGTGTMTTTDHWFRFDSMNRLVVDRGALSGAAGAAGTTIIRLGAGYGNQPSKEIVYDAAGRRVSETRSLYQSGTIYDPYNQPDPMDPHGPSGQIFIEFEGAERTDYSYGTSSGLVESVRTAQTSYQDNWDGTFTIIGLPGTGTVVSTFGYDLMGRQTNQTDYRNAAAVHNRTATYNAKGQLTADNSWTIKGDNKTYSSATSYYFTDYTTSEYQLGSVAWSQSINGVTGQSSVTARTINTHTWYDGAVQSSVSHKPNISQGTTWTTSYTYNGFGQLTSVYVGDGMPKTVTFTNDENGQIIRRAETKPTNAPSAQVGSPHEVWYRYGGRQMGFVGNNGTGDLSMSESINTRRSTVPNPQGSFALGRVYGISYADFALSYDPINSYSQGSSAGSYRVRAGDTLASIAAQLWGDANLWYKIAEANGMGAHGALIEGQALVLPAGVVRSTHNASTFKPYDPADAIGELSPTTPKPKKNPKCGVFGQILMAAIAIGVAIALPHLIPALKPAMLGGGILGGAASGAIGATAGSIVSQGFGIAAGIQDGFSWKGVAMSALGGAIGGGIGGSGVFGKVNATGGFDPGKIGIKSGILDAAVRGAASSALTQGIAVATGLQSKFSFAGVAAAGVAGGVGYRVGKAAGATSLFDDQTPRNIAANAVEGAARLFANAATRSAISGSNFGDNIMAGLPDTLGQIIGSSISGAIAGGNKTAGLNTVATALGAVTGGAAAVAAGVAKVAAAVARNPSAIADDSVNTTTEAVAVGVTGSTASTTSGVMLLDDPVLGSQGGGATATGGAAQAGQAARARSTVRTPRDSTHETGELSAADRQQVLDFMAGKSVTFRNSHAWLVAMEKGIDGNYFSLETAQKYMVEKFMIEPALARGVADSDVLATGIGIFAERLFDFDGGFNEFTLRKENIPFLKRLASSGELAPLFAITHDVVNATYQGWLAQPAIVRGQENVRELAMAGLALMFGPQMAAMSPTLPVGAGIRGFLGRVGWGAAAASGTNHMFTTIAAPFTESDQTLLARAIDELAPGYGDRFSLSVDIAGGGYALGSVTKAVLSKFGTFTNAAKGVARVGNTRTVTEVPLDRLIPLHPVPRPEMSADHIDNLVNSIRRNGFDVNRAIQVVKMPNGELVIFGGHHRAAAMGRLGESTIPAKVSNWSDMKPNVQQRWIQRFPNIGDFVR